MDLFDVLVARKYSDGGGGGGGSSDFTVATVTLVDGDGVGARLYGAFVSNGISVGECYTDDGSIDIILYKGSAEIDAQRVPEENATCSVSGNATQDLAYTITVTGDCTITVQYMNT